MYAIYTRQSIFKEDSISIESQIEHCLYETKGDAYKTYEDRGYSGKNTDRPNFQAMLEDIRQGLIDTVVVYKLDRISRSILDFANLMELFQQYHVEFVSTTEKFDTSTPVGRAMLNICIVFAQLERETIQQRVTDAYYSRIQKGFYMGGRIPYGFKKVPVVIHGIKTSMYKTDPEEAEQIKLMYKLYSEPQTSYGDIVKYFAQNGILKNGKQWGRTRLTEYLRNPIYVKADQSIYNFYKGQGVTIVIDREDFIGTNGCYLFRGQTEQIRKSDNMKDNILVLAPHEGFIPSDVWLKCRTKCLNNVSIQTGRKVVHCWLAGKIKCGNCGYALSRKSFKNQKAYYLCSKRLNLQNCEGCGTIHADELENLIFREMFDKLKAFHSPKGNSTIVNPQTKTLESEIVKIEDEISALMGKLITANEVLTAYINQRVLELDGQKRELLKQLSKCHSTQHNVDTNDIQNYLSDWENLALDDKRTVVDTLIEVIHATEKHVEIKWKF